ncbi:vitamin-D-receptor interacting mediator subunit 4-domain-containing protein [Gaertneriomyces semiglobifer]|nr:vitamin-D-receptor interacting mediator subunit 4-domain-containing protein [Gaertneriomyces semiglobifer]
MITTTAAITEPAGASTETVGQVADRLLPQYLQLATTLFQSLVSSDDEASELAYPTHILRELQALDNGLQTFVNRLEQHQQTQNAIEKVQQEIMECRLQRMLFNSRMAEGQFALEDLIAEANELLASARKAEDNTVDLSTLTSYALRISKYTMANDARFHEPPIPQDHHMRMSGLFKAGSAEATVTETDDTTPTDEQPQPEIIEMQEQTRFVEEDMLDLDLDL